MCKAILDDKQYFWFDVAVFPEIKSSLYVSESQWCHTFQKEFKLHDLPFTVGETTRLPFNHITDMLIDLQ